MRPRDSSTDPSQGRRVGRDPRLDCEVLPAFLVGAGVNFGGGLASNALVKKLGLKWDRRSIGVLGLGIAALCTVAVMFTRQWLGALILLSLIYGGIAFQQPTTFAVCLDIGGEYAGAVVGAMNTASQIGSFVSSLPFGYLVGRYGSYNVPFTSMAALILTCAWLWRKVDPTRTLIPGVGVAHRAQLAVT